MQRTFLLFLCMGSLTELIARGVCLGGYGIAVTDETRDLDKRSQTGTLTLQHLGENPQRLQGMRTRQGL